MRCPGIMSYAARDEFCILFAAERGVAQSIQYHIHRMANAVKRRGAVGSPDWLSRLSTNLGEQTVSMRKNF